MVFGDVQSERIQLNEDTIWAGEKRNRINPEGARNLAEVRRLLFAGKPKEAELLAEKTIISVPKRMPPYQPLGDLLIRFEGQENASEYVRELDLDTAVVRVTYRAGGKRFTREVFCLRSGPGNCDSVDQRQAGRTFIRSHADARTGQPNPGSPS